MVVIVPKKYDRKRINQQIKELKPSKVFNPAKFAGKMVWAEDPLTYQKQLRNEWD